MTPDWRQYIVSTPEVLHGKARLKGTRIPVSMVIGFLAEGCTHEQIIEQYPDLTREQVLACLGYALELTQSQTPAGV